MQFTFFSEQSSTGCCNQRAQPAGDPHRGSARLRQFDNFLDPIVGPGRYLRGLLGRGGPHREGFAGTVTVVTALHASAKISPLSVIQPLKQYPLSAMAVMVTVSPAAKLPAPLTAPPSPATTLSASVETAGVAVTSPERAL